MAKQIFTLCCHSCNAIPTVGPAICPKCGPSYLRIDGYEPNPSFNYQNVYQCCSQPADGRSFPKKCTSCGSHDLGWKNPSDSTWLPEEQSDNEDSNSIWVSGDFDGDYVGSSLVASGVKLSGPSAFSVRIIGGQLKNILKVDLPPESREEGEKEWFFQDQVDNIDFLYESSRDPAASTYHGSLTHFQIHQWQKMSVLPNEGGTSSLNGRIVGKAYGQIVQPKDDDSIKPINHIETKDKSITRKSYWEALKDHAQAAYKIGVRSGYNAVMQQKQNGRNDPVGSNPAATPTPLTLAPDSGCRHCNIFFMLATFFSVWLLCSLKRAFIAEIPFVIMCYWGFLRRSGSAPLFQFGKKIEIGVAIAMVAGALGILLVYGYQDHANTQCSPYLPWWVISIGFILLLTALLDVCWLWVVIGLIWVYALLFQCSISEGRCYVPNVIINPNPGPGPNPPTPVNNEKDLIKKDDKNIIQNIVDKTLLINKKLENVVDDVTTNKIIDPVVTETDKGGRINLNKALSDPKKYFSCGSTNSKKAIYDIYVGGDALFPFNSCEINASVLNLSKLAQLLQKEPNVKITITGHSDLAGSDEIKLTKSTCRAEAVANWLVSNGVMAQENIQVKGMADLDPVTTSLDRDFQELNRRVEIRLDCP